MVLDRLRHHIHRYAYDEAENVDGLQINWSVLFHKRLDLSVRMDFSEYIVVGEDPPGVLPTGRKRKSKMLVLGTHPIHVPFEVDLFIYPHQYLCYLFDFHL